MTIEHGDGLPDDRVTCGTCKHFAAGNSFCRGLRMVTWASCAVRCLTFAPLAADRDQRDGRQRWPRLAREIEEVREMDRLHAQRRSA